MNVIKELPVSYIKYFIMDAIKFYVEDSDLYLEFGRGFLKKNWKTTWNSFLDFTKRRFNKSLAL